MLASRHKKLYLMFGFFLCLLYTFHISSKAIIKTDGSCSKYSTKHQIDGDWRKVQYGLSEKESVLSKNGSALNRSIILTKLTKVDYFGCIDFENLPNITPSRSENFVGNRGISFLKVRIDGVTIPAVYKEAHRVLDTPSEFYKQNMALREIEYLIKLQQLQGIPRLFGSCIKKYSVSYLVERIEGSMFCNDNGTTVNCTKAKYLIHSVQQAPDPMLAAIKLVLSTLTLFRHLEKRHLFFEDISGVNLMFTSDFEVYLIDADSLVFYNETRLYSKMSCTDDSECSGPFGNLWVPNSLNGRMYAACRDMHGICEHGTCRGFDVSLHACGLAEWFICKLIKLFEKKPEYLNYYQSVCACMKQPEPQKRCSFAKAEEKMKNLLRRYLTTKKEEA